MAWVGRQGDVWDALESAGAEKDDEGRFFVASPDPGPGPEPFSYSSFMGSSSEDSDVAIGDSLRYRKSGEWLPVVELLGGKGVSGVKVY